jgi:hypothetical protein
MLKQVTPGGIYLCVFAADQDATYKVMCPMQAKFPEAPRVPYKKRKQSSTRGQRTAAKKSKTAKKVKPITTRKGRSASKKKA